MRTNSKVRSQQSVAGILDEVECIVEIGEVAIVRGGNDVCAAVLLQEVGEHTHFAASLTIGCLRCYDAVIVFVHDKEHIEAVEIGCAYLPCMTVESIAPQRTTLAHAPVGQLPHMPVADTGRVDYETVVETGSVHFRLHHTLGSRRATDIAEADKQQADFLVRICIH